MSGSPSTTKGVLAVVYREVVMAGPVLMVFGAGVSSAKKARTARPSYPTGP
jgi:hypothetical protein